MIEFFIHNKELIIIGLGFAIIAISANQIARTFQKIHLPLITGLILTGIISGPFILGLIPENAGQKLSVINDTALAFIAFAAGAELYLRELRDRINSIKWNTFGQLVVTFVIGSIAVYFFSDMIPYMTGKSNAIKISISVITASIFVARSPASAIAVISELRAKGPFTQTVMGVTVVKDFLVIILFSICLTVAQMQINGESFNILSIVILITELLTTCILGFFIFGRFLQIALGLKIRKYFKTGLILLIGYGSYLLSSHLAEYSKEHFGHVIYLEPLLMCILASFYVTNYTRFRSEFIKILSDSGLPVYVAFFTLTGASLNIGVLVNVFDVALLLFGIRLIAMIIGSYFGGYLAKDPIKHIHFGWMPYVTQAGVALGLATVVANQFPDWGNQLATVIIALIIINQFFGPSLFKWAIFQIGEDRIKGTPFIETARNAIIFGFDPKSLALSRQLMENNWTVQLVTLMKKGQFEEPKDIKIHYIDGLEKSEFDKIKMGENEAVVTMLSDDENLKICELAYHVYGTRDLIVRLNDRLNYQNFLALDARIVDPSTAIVSLLDHFVRSPQATSLLLGMEAGQDTRDVELKNPNLHGVYLRDLRLPSDVIILSVIRGGHTIISHGYTRLRVGDIVTVVGSIDSLEEVQLKFD